MNRFVTLGLLLALTLPACAAGTGEPTQSPDATPVATSSPTPEPDVETTKPTESPRGDEQMQLVEEIKADAAERAGVEPEDVEVVKNEAVIWNDGSLGCPVPGFSYTQALVDGRHIIVEAGDRTLDYRVGNGTFRLCEQASS